MGEAAWLIVVTGDDVSVEGAMAVAALKSAAGAGGAEEPIVNNAGRLPGIAKLIKAKMSGRTGAIIEATVADIHGETGGGKLGLRKAFSRQPGKIAGSGGDVAGQIA